jgi:hypothetical protein
MSVDALARAILKMVVSPGLGRCPGESGLHELGHATGVEHVSSVGEQMNPTLTAASPNGCAAGDKAGRVKLLAAS